MPPFFRDNIAGHYGMPTSTMDFCEENFAVTLAVAEFWNTISSLAIFFPSFLTGLYLWEHNMAEFRFVLLLFSGACVGLGSFAFHCTLLYEFQLLDELPMVYCSLMMLYCVADVKGKEHQNNTLLMGFLGMLAVLFTLIYLLTKNPLIFLVCYAILVVLIFSINIYHCLKSEGSWHILLFSTLCYGFGFLLWVIDTRLCFELRPLRPHFPFDFIFQLHSWWHVFAGTAGYTLAIFQVDLRLKVLGFRPVKRFLFKYLLFYIKEGNSDLKFTV